MIDHVGYTEECILATLKAAYGGTTGWRRKAYIRIKTSKK